jgi:hypothetical protein
MKLHHLAHGLEFDGNGRHGKVQIICDKGCQPFMHQRDPVRARQEPGRLDEGWHGDFHPALDPGSSDRLFRKGRATFDMDRHVSAAGELGLGVHGFHRRVPGATHDHVPFHKQQFAGLRGVGELFGSQKQIQLPAAQQCRRRQLGQAEDLSRLALLNLPEPAAARRPCNGSWSRAF